MYAATLFGTYQVAETVEQDDSIPHVTLTGVTFHVETFGDSSNPVIIVVHGGPGGDFRHLLNLQALANDYYVVFYDQRGTGLSPRVDSSELTLDSSIEDLNLIVEHYGEGEPVNIVGHSWGAMLATAYVGRYPDRVAHLVVAEPGILSNEANTDFQGYFSQAIDFSLALKATRLWFESLHVNGPDDFARNDYFTGRISEEWWFSANNRYNCSGAQLPDNHTWRAGAVAGRSILNSVNDDNGDLDMSVLTEGLDRYTRTVLMIVSECNQWIGLEHQRKHHLDLYQAVEVVVVPGAGHDMFWENPDDSIAAIRNFLSK